MSRHSRTAEIPWSVRRRQAQLAEARPPILGSCLMGIVLSVASFAATLAVLKTPVAGATARPAAGKPVERSFAMVPFPKALLTPLVQSTPAAPPAVRVASEPTNASVRDVRGNALGSTPLFVNVGTDLVITHDGYRDKHVALALREQSMLVVLARNTPTKHHRARR